MKNNSRPIAVAAAAVALLCSWGFHPAAEAGGSAPNTAATTRQIMLAMTVPTSNAVFAAGGEAPTDDKA